MSSIKKTTNLYCLNAVQQKGLNLQLNKLNLHNRLILTLNKQIKNFPHKKVSDKLGGSLNQNIIFNFNKNNANTDRRLINKNFVVLTRPSILTVGAPKGQVGIGENAIKLLSSKVTDLGPVQVKNPARLGIINNVVHIITSFFKGLGCIISVPQFIHKTDKLIIRIFYNQNNNFNKDALFSNNKFNFIFNLFNGTDAAKAQYGSPKSQNFAAIIRDMLGQTKWNKIAQTVFKNNEAINSLELASISKKVFMLFIKDLMNLTSSKKGLSIEKALIQLQKGAPSIATMPTTPTLKGSGVGRFMKAGRTTIPGGRGKGLIGFKKYNQLMIKLISSTNSDYLTRKRTRLSKIFFNKNLLDKLTKKVNNHNNNINLNSYKADGLGTKNIIPKELIGKGLLLNPVNKKKLEALLTWSNIELSHDYKTIATALLVLVQNKKINNPQIVSGPEIKLANKINKNLTSMSTQFADEVSKYINFIFKKEDSLKGVPAPTLRKGNAVNTKLTKSILLPLKTLGEQVTPLKVIKLINKQLGQPSLEQQGADKSLTLVKEAFKAFNYGLNSNKNGLIPSNIIGTADNVNRFKLLGILLAKILKKNIDLQIVKLHNVGLEETILAKVISENAKFDKSSVLIKKLLRKIAVSKASLIQFNKQNKILNNNALLYNSKLHNTFSVPVLSKLNITEQIGTKQGKAISESQKNIRFNQLHDNIDNIATLQTNPLALGKVVGLNIRIAGRLLKDALRPKQTVRVLTVGSLSKERSNSSSFGSFVSKNRRGAVKISVKMSHIKNISTSARSFLINDPSLSLVKETDKISSNFVFKD